MVVALSLANISGVDRGIGGPGSGEDRLPGGEVAREAIQPGHDQEVARVQRGKGVMINLP